MLRNFYSIDDFKPYDYTKHEAVIALPGLLTYTSKSLLEFCKRVRDESKQKEIRIFIHTWDTEFNLPFLEGIKKEIQENYPGLILDVETEPYNSGKFIDVLKNITPEYNNSVFIKWVLIWYSMNNIADRIHQYNNDAYVFRVRSAMRFEYLSYFSTIYQDMNKTLDIIYKSSIPGTFLTHPKNIIYNLFTSRDSTNEHVFSCHIEKFLNTVGFSPDNISRKLKKIVEYYSTKFPGMPMDDGLSLEIHHFASTTFKFLIDLWDENPYYIPLTYFQTTVRSMFVNTEENKEMYPNFLRVNPTFSYDEHNNVKYDLDPVVMQKALDDSMILPINLPEKFLV